MHQRQSPLRWRLAVAVVPLALAGACLLALMLQPPTWRVARTRTLHASPARVRDVLSDVRTFAACCAPPEARATPAATTFSPTTRGPGAWLEWWSAPGTRERATIETATANRVTMRYDVGGRGSRQLVEWRPSAAGADRTDVTWSLEGSKSGFLQRLLWPFVGLEARVSRSIDDALANLDRAAR